MPARYTLKVVTDFAAAHRLQDYPGECSRLHGHNWKLEVEVQASALDDIGMGMDFKAIKQAARDAISGLDHTYLNELDAFRDRNPTAEHIAAYLFRSLAERLNGAHTRIAAVTLWETERACVRYTEE